MIKCLNLYCNRFWLYFNKDIALHTNYTQRFIEQSQNNPLEFVFEILTEKNNLHIHLNIINVKKLHKILCDPHLAQQFINN